MEPLDVEPIGPDPRELAARFLALLLERELIELAPGDPTALVEAVRVVLDAPPEQRAEALDDVVHVRVEPEEQAPALARQAQPVDPYPDAFGGDQGFARGQPGAAGQGRSQILR